MVISKIERKSSVETSRIGIEIPKCLLEFKNLRFEIRKITTEIKIFNRYSNRFHL